MEIYFHKLRIASSDIYLLEFTDEFDVNAHIDKLTAIEQERFFGFNNLKRQQEFVATRLLKHQVFGYDEIKYHNHGAPFLEQEGFISISHAQNLVGIANNPDFQIGFDIEAISPKVLKLFPKYLNELELDLFDTSSEEELIKAWSFKETLYKLAGRKLIDFKKDLLLLDYKNDWCKAKINNPSTELFTELQAINFERYIITINTKEVSYVEK